MSFLYVLTLFIDCTYYINLASYRFSMFLVNREVSDKSLDCKKDESLIFLDRSCYTQAINRQLAPYPQKLLHYQVESIKQVN